MQLFRVKAMETGREETLELQGLGQGQGQRRGHPQPQPQPPRIPRPAGDRASGCWVAATVASSAAAYAASSAASGVPTSATRSAAAAAAAVAAAIFPEREAVTLSGRRGPSRRASLSWGEAAEGP